MNRIDYLSFKEVFLFLNTVVKPIVFRNLRLRRRSLVISSLFSYSNIERIYEECKYLIESKGNLAYYTIIHSYENEYMFFIRMILVILFKDELTINERYVIIHACDSEFDELKKKFSKNKFNIALTKLKRKWIRLKYAINAKI